MAKSEFTQKQVYEAVIAIANGENTEIPAHKIIEFAEKKLAQLDTKSSKTDDKKSAEQRAVMDMIISVLCASDKQMKCGDIVKAVNAENGTDYSSSKINAMLRKLLPADEKNPNGTGEVIRTEKGKDVFFSLAE